MICYQEAVGREERLKGEAVSAPPPGCAGYRASKLTESQGLAFFQGHIPHLEFLFTYIFLSLMLMKGCSLFHYLPNTPPCPPLPPLLSHPQP